jgi:hypothetical protein
MDSIKLTTKTDQAMQYLLHRIKEIWSDSIGYTDDGYTVTDRSTLHEQAMCIFASTKDLDKFLNNKMNTKILVTAGKGYIEVAGNDEAIDFIRHLPIWYKRG